MLEMDSGKLLLAIQRANDAILDKIEQTDRISFANELPMLNDALNNLRLLRREYECATKESAEEQSERKTG